MNDPYPPAGTGPGVDVASRRDAVTRLGTALRALNHAMVVTEVGEDVLDRATETVRALTEALGADARSAHEPSSVDDLAAGIRMFNASSGPANPIAPPVVATHADGRVVGRATLGPAHEGHVTYGHGGVLATVLDDVLGRTVTEHATSPAVTSRLVVRYRRPVPLCTPLVIAGELVGVEDRRVTVRATVCAQAEPDVVLAEAEAWFVQLREDQVTAMFGSPAGAGAFVARQPGVAGG